MVHVQIKRIYDSPEKSDGFRVLVDRIWPRGLTREEADIDLWAKDLAPSTELRHWFGHDPEKWKEFQKRYRHELKPHADELRKLLHEAGPRVTLLFAAKDTEHNNAVVLASALQDLA